MNRSVPSKRSCGTCTLCCKTHLVLELDKAAGKTCSHCSPGQGCTIYPQRPQSCNGFACWWLRGIGAEHERPDHTGVVIESIPNIVMGRGALMLWEGREGALESSFAQRVGEMMLRSYPVFCMRLSGDYRLYLPVNLLLDQETTHKFEEEGFTILFAHQFPE